ncbi:hypothetical protein AK812_SmicGene33544 [Symbiodinium microadriaticum]|uniref:OTU domain-containing protein n=1 Tax=Symbiodinium microadriaticum TaxID=2951 RepID=A0A1Q9CRB2_SYMMI|nr:hypothetical protein AK812_SmicGene33544 [Symbiodinium microadriaticum]
MHRSNRRWADITDDDGEEIGWDIQAFRKHYLATKCSLTLLTPVRVPACLPADRKDQDRRGMLTVCMEDVPNDNNTTEQHDRSEAIATPTQEGGANHDSPRHAELGPSIEDHFRGRLALKKMTGDGNCLFHALANKTQEDGVQLRSLIIQFLQDNAACEDDEEQTDAWLEEAEYLHSNPRHWGGDTAIIAFTLMRQQRVFLHWRTADGEIQTIERTHTDVATAAERRPRERQNFMQAIHLWYNGRDHYDVLVPTDELAHAAAPPSKPSRPAAAASPPPPNETKLEGPDGWNLPQRNPPKKIHKKRCKVTCLTTKF